MRLRALLGWLLVFAGAPALAQTNAAFRVPEREQNLLRAPFATRSHVNSFCAMFAGEMTGRYFCWEGDGDQVTEATMTLTESGSPTRQNVPVCPNGSGCETINAPLFDIGTPAVKTPTVTSYTGDFSCWVVADKRSSGTRFALAREPAAGKGFNITGSTALMRATIFKGDASSTAVGSATTDTGEVALFVATYDFVADGSSVLRLYKNGTQNAVSSVAVGPMQVATKGWWIGAREAGGGQWDGHIFTAGCTEKIISAATVAEMSAAVVGSVGKANREVFTYSRASGSSCQATGASVSWVPTNVPCIIDGRLAMAGAATTQQRSFNDFTDATAWEVTQATTTANTSTAPDGSNTADTLTATSNSGQVQSFGTSIATLGGATVATASLWVKTLAGTQAGEIQLRDGVANTLKCTGSFTATTTWQYVFCTATALTTANSHLLRILPAGASTGSIVAWGGNWHPGLDVPTIYTEGSSAARSIDVAYVTPVTMPGSAGSIGIDYIPRVDPATVKAGGLPVSLLDTRISASGVGVTVSLSSATASAVVLVSADASTSTTVTGSALAWTVGQKYRIVVSWAGATATVFRDGVSAVTTAAGKNPTGHTRIYLGVDGNSISNAYGEVALTCVSRDQKGCL